MILKVNKRSWLGMLAMALLFGMLLAGCSNPTGSDSNDSTNDKTITQSLQGSWKLTSSVYSGTTYTVPYTIPGVITVNSYVYNINATQVKLTLNGTSEVSYDGCYTNGNQLYYNGANIWTFQVSGANLTITYNVSGEIDHFVKVP